MPIVTLANKVFFVAQAERTLLDSAKAAGVLLEYSCRTGRCGICKAKVLQGDTVVLQVEQALDQQELNVGYILTCCRAATSELNLDIDDLSQFAGCESKTLPCRIDSISSLSNDVISVVLRVPPGNSLKYLVGQYVDVIGAGGLRRSYSIANAPRDDGKLELQIRKVERGVMSQYWFGNAKPNDLLRLEGPLGTFSLRNIEPSNILFLATGTGIAPVKAMLEGFAKNPEYLLGKNIVVYWGGRIPADIYWQPSFANLNIQFVPVLSRVGTDWAGRVGYAQRALLDDAIDLSDSVVYACGSEQMIRSARQQLIEAGLAPKNFHFDAFVSSN